MFAIESARYVHYGLLFGFLNNLLEQYPEVYSIVLYSESDHLRYGGCVVPVHAPRLLAGEPRSQAMKRRLTSVSTGYFG